MGFTRSISCLEVARHLHFFINPPDVMHNNAYRHLKPDILAYVRNKK